MEAHYQALHRYLPGLPGGRRYHYFKYPSLETLGRHGHCPAENPACYQQGRGVEASVPFEQHELVHAYLAELGDSHRLLEEGAAVALSCGGALRVPAKVPWQRAFTPRLWETAEPSAKRRLYDAAGSFVGYVLHRFGTELFLEFYGRLEPNTPYQQVEAEFQRVFAQPLPLIWTQALAQDPESACVLAYECSAPNFTDAPLEKWGQACEQGDLYRTVELDGWTWLEEVSRGYGLRIASCNPATQLPFSKSFSADKGGESLRSILSLPIAGRYVFAKAEGETGLVFHREQEARFLPEACGEARPWTGEGEVTVAFHERVLNRGQERFLAWRTGHKAGHVYDYRCAVGLSLSVCPSCEAEECVRLCDAAELRSGRKSFDERTLFRLSSSSSAWFELLPVTH